MPARIFPITPATITLGETVEVEMAALVPNVSSVGVIGQFKGNFTKALYLRSHNAAEVERRLGYGHGRLAPGWWLLFALDRPSPDNFEFGGYTHFSGSRVGNPALGSARPHVEDDLVRTFGGQAGLAAAKARHVAALELTGPNRLAKVIPVSSGAEYPVGAGVYQCNITAPIRCKVAAFVPPGGAYRGDYT
jgi:hypothetical protein